MENEYDERLNQILQRNLDYIKECFDNNKYVHPHFIYLPNLVNDLSQDVRSFSYMMPYVKDVNISTSISLKSSDLLDYLLVPENRSKIKPCFARYRGEEHGNYLFECVGFEPDEDIDEKKFIRALCSAFDYYPMSVGPVYQESMLREGADADDKFENEYRQLIEEVEERILQLRKMGISQWALEQMVKPELKLSRLIITKDYRILLPDYNNIEIKMEPLIKAVYLLFLNHPEGILFKHLPDYRKELAQIYEKLKPYGMSDKVFQSIEDVTNPLLNSINEKCARIRGAFVSRFDESLACNYYIYGLRGKAKKISLPRDLIIWE